MMELPLKNCTVFKYYVYFHRKTIYIALNALMLLADEVLLLTNTSCQRLGKVKVEISLNRLFKLIINDLLKNTFFSVDRNVIPINIIQSMHLIKELFNFFFFTISVNMLNL